MSRMVSQSETAARRGGRRLPNVRSGAYWDGGFEVLSEDDERILCRGWRRGDDGERRAVLVVLPSAEHASATSLDHLAREYELRGELDPAWAAQPLELVHDGGLGMLVLDDAGGEPLDQMLGATMETGRFLCVAIGVAAALGKVHEKGLIHKDIKPNNILVDSATGAVRLTGFGVASRLSRERQTQAPTKVIAGTLAYMAPEQTGRMNRSIDSRSDLYACGVTFYEMLAGALPFHAADPIGWIHCHIARQPAPLSERVDGIPATLSAIVMKLLSKIAEERYQTAAGVEHDLRRCLAEWERRRGVEPFALGERDRPDKLVIPEKLYGRAREVGSLLAAFDRVVESGAPELVLISGYSGIGKSSVVNELHKALVPVRGIFASGKFDQLKRDIPYSTIAQAFDSLVRLLLSESDAELARWRRALLEALGPNGRLITDIIPALKFIIGDQSPIPEVAPQQTQARFQSVFRRFIGVFTTAEHPLALFLDDLQWLDGATLDLIEDLLTQADVRRLLLVGAYRDNEVDAAHPLMGKLDAVKIAGGKVTEITLAPLRPEHFEQLIADALRCETEGAAPLAQLAHEKTGGNPFFAIQFLTALNEDGLLAFDPVAPAWRWDIGRIRARSYTDNVADLLVEKMLRLSLPPQEAMKRLACLGSVVDVATLALVYEETEEGLHLALSEAVHAGLVLRQESAYTFLHDRIQLAAYSLIPEESRADLHLRIGRALLASMTPDHLAEHIFDVANQFNRGAARLIDRDEKARVATIHLRAGRKAKASAAYASACAYLAAGMALLDEADWDSQYELMFGQRLERAECEFLSGNLDKAENLIAELLRRAASRVDLVAAYTLRVELYTAKSESIRALNSALTCLRLLDIDLPMHPTWHQVQAECEVVWRTLNGRPIESLIDLPLMTDLDVGAVIRLLSVLNPSAYYTDFHLYCLIACRMSKIVMQYGISDASTLAHFGNILGPAFHRYRDGYRFTKLARDLVNKHGFIASRAKVYLTMGKVAFWSEPVGTAIDLLRATIRAATEAGDLTMACFSMDACVTGFLLRNDPLEAVWRESEKNLAFVRKAQFHDVAFVIVSQQRFIAAMQGRTAPFSSFNDVEFEEAALEARLTEDRTATAVCLYWILKLQLRFYSGDYVEALAAADKAKALLWASSAHIQLLDYYYYAALSVAACYENGSANQQQEWRDLLTAHREQLREWAENCPPTFADKHALASAEVARIEGRDAEAMRLYEQAILSAHDNGYVHNEALAYELAARFYEARGFKDFAQVYLQKARDGYRRWGADGKVRQLEEMYPHLRTKDLLPAPTTTIRAPVESVDLATVIKVSQAISGEIVLEKLLETLMRTAIEHAGAERVLLIAPRGDELRVEAEATTSNEEVAVHLPDGAHASPVMPESLVRYVIRTKENVILDDASSPNPFAADPYFVQHPSRSILCLPLINQAKVTGVLFLENNLTPRVFAPARISVLTLVASHAAIALQNARLYREVEEREKRQAATSKMLRIISNSPIQSVLDMVAEHAARLSDAANAEIFRLEGNLLRLVASYGDIPVVIHAYQGVAVNRDTVTGRAASDRRTIHVHDLPAEEDEYPAGSSNAKREGHRTTLATPLLREDAPVGIILVRRREVRPFSDEEIALIETFADHAVIAIENARLFEAEKQRALALAHANRDLQDRERKIRRLVESNIIGVFFGDFDGRIFEANDAFLRIVGYDKEDLASGRINWSKLTPQDWRDRDARWIDGHKRTGVLQPVEKEYLRKDGSRVPVLLGAATVEEGGNQSVTFVLDLSERKRAQEALRDSEEALRRSEAYLAEAQQLSHTGSVAFSEASVLFFSDETYRILGFDPSHGLPSREAVAQRMHPDDRESAHELARQARREKRDYKVKYRFILPNGTIKHIESTSHPKFTASGDFVEVVSTIVDVTERIRAQDEREKLRRLETDLAHKNRLSMMGELTASLAHEITQPIAAARNNARAALNFLNRQPAELGEVREALDCVVSDTDRAGQIIDRIRDQIKKTPPRKVRLDLNEAIDEVIGLARSVIAKNGVTVRTRLTEGALAVKGDRVQLQQVVLNLILNAVEAMSAVDESVHELLLSTERSATYGVLVSVSDSGPGIDLERRERVFDAFYTTKTSGVGMGLSICRSIIDAHGGRLWVVENQPRGAVFQFTLPTAKRNS